MCVCASVHGCACIGPEESLYLTECCGYVPHCAPDKVDNPQMSMREEEREEVQSVELLRSP